MTPEQERLLHIVAGTVERIDERTEAFERWVDAHEASDAQARQDLNGLMEYTVKSKTAVRIFMAIGLALSTVIGWFVAIVSAQ